MSTENGGDATAGRQTRRGWRGRWGRARRIKLPVHRRTAAILAVLAVPALICGTVLGGPASASTEFTAQLSPNNTFFLFLQVQDDAPGAHVIDWSASGTPAQEWTFIPTGANQTYEIQNDYTGLCLTAYPAPGDPVWQWGCNDGPAQQWVTALQPDGGLHAYTIQNVNSGLYLDVQNNNSFPGAVIDTYTYTGGSNQHFAGF